MAITNDIDFRGLSVTGALLRISDVNIKNGPADADKIITIQYAVFASQTDYAAGEPFLVGTVLRINKATDSASFAAFVSKMREVNEDVFSAAYIAVKQLADWTGATDANTGDE